jgi:hypothetical protein
VRVPDDVRQRLRAALWARADELGWQNLTWVEKSPIYEAWTKDPEVGGVLSRFMDARQVRVYIKDTVMKGYVRNRQADAAAPLRMLGIDAASVAETFERPHGRRLNDGRVIAWGNAEDWKLVVMALYERSYGDKACAPYAAVLFQARGKFHDAETRLMVEGAASKLGVARVLWNP